MLIGISGKIGSGKNEVADMLSYMLFRKKTGTFEEFQKQQYFRNQYLAYGMYDRAEDFLPNIHSFANNLKQCTALCTGIDYHSLENRAQKASKISWLGLTHRELLQRFAEAIRCQIDEDFWVKSMLATYQNSEDWIISDLRYENEARALKERGAVLVRIHRPRLGYNDHISEVNLDNYPDFDYHIDNTGDLKDLYNSVQEFCNFLKDKH